MRAIMAGGETAIGMAADQLDPGDAQMPVSTSSIHAYQVALKTLRERCRKQTEQLHSAHDESKRLIADKAVLHGEIERLRDAASRQRERAAQLSRQLADRQTLSRRLCRRLMLQSQQLHLLRRQLADAGLPADDVDDEMDGHEAAAMLAHSLSLDGDSLSNLTAVASPHHQADRDTAELHVSAAPPPPPLDNTEHWLLVGLQQVESAVRQRNSTLRQCMHHVTQKVASHPPDGKTTRLISSDRVVSCPLCGDTFPAQRTPALLEDHVYDHLTQLLSENPPSS